MLRPVQHSRGSVCGVVFSKAVRQNNAQSCAMDETVSLYIHVQQGSERSFACNQHFHIHCLKRNYAAN